MRKLEFIMLCLSAICWFAVVLAVFLPIIAAVVPGILLFAYGSGLAWAALYAVRSHIKGVEWLKNSY